MEPDSEGNAIDFELRELVSTALINQSMINSHLLLLISFLAEGREVKLEYLQGLAEMIQSGTSVLFDVVGLSSDARISRAPTD